MKSNYQVAASYNGVRHTDNYFQFFRLNSNRETGWLEIKFTNQLHNESSEWLKRFVVFENTNDSGGILYISLSPEQVHDEETSTSVPMEQVVSFRTDNNTSDNIIKLQTTDFKLTLKANSKMKHKDGYFTFQKSVAFVLSKLMKTNDSSPFNLSIRDDSNTTRNNQLINKHGVYNLNDRQDSNNTNKYNDSISKSDKNIGYSNFSRQKSIDSDLYTIHHKYNDNTAIAINNDTQWASVPSNNIPLAKSPAVKIETLSRNSLTGYTSNRLRNRTISGQSETMILIDQSINNEVNEKLAKSYMDGIESSNLLDTVMKDIKSNYNSNCYDEDDISFDDIDNEYNHNQSMDDLLFTIDELEINQNTNDNNTNSSDKSKHSTNTQSNRWCLQWEYGSCSKLGPRESNEDRFITIDNYNQLWNNFSTLSNDLHGYFAVYDGHCGADAAAYLQENLHIAIINHPLFNSDIVRAITETCIDIDKQFLEICKVKNFARGSTAIGVFLRGKELILFNIGDSGAVISKNGKAEEVMQAHKPNRPDEKERIAQARGWITEEKELFFGRLHMMDLSDPIVVDKAKNLNWVVIHRICGEIAVSRSIGDPVYKNFIPGAVVDEFFSWPEGHDRIFMADLIIPTPECTVLTISQSQEFIIIASDGLWDVVNYQEAVDRVSQSFKDNKSPTQASEELSELALRLGSSDNVTVVIVKFIRV